MRDVVAVLDEAGFTAQTTTARGLGTVAVRPCLGVVVSYAVAGSVRALRRRCGTVWLDAVDSWLLVDRSGLRAGHPLYAARVLRDAATLATMPRPDLVTWISAADRAEDRGTVRGRRRLVLPGRPDAPVLQPSTAPAGRLLMAGDWSYAPNRDGLAWFVDLCLPLLEDILQGVDWSIVLHGPHAPALPWRFRIAGYVADESELYQVGDVHLAPVAHGAGVKRKVLSPLLAGLPVVTTPAGAHGLKKHPLLDVAAEPAVFAALTAARLRGRAGVVQPPPAGAVVDADDSEAVLAWLASVADRCPCAGSR